MFFTVLFSFFCLLLLLQSSYQLISALLQIKQKIFPFSMPVLIVHCIIFIYQIWQFTFFIDERNVALIPFPSSIFAHAFFFIIPVLLFIMLSKLVYFRDWGKRITIYWLMAIGAGIISWMIMPGKDLLWFSGFQSFVLIIIGLKLVEIQLHYRHYLRYFFFGNSWICLFSFGGMSFFTLGFVLQLISQYYLNNLLSLFWVEERFKKVNSENHKQTKNIGYLLGLSN